MCLKEIVHLLTWGFKLREQFCSPYRKTFFWQFSRPNTNNRQRYWTFCAFLSCLFEEFVLIFKVKANLKVTFLQFEATTSTNQLAPEDLRPRTMLASVPHGGHIAVIGGGDCDDIEHFTRPLFWVKCLSSRVFNAVMGLSCIVCMSAAPGRRVQDGWGKFIWHLWGSSVYFVSMENQCRNHGPEPSFYIISVPVLENVLICTST